MLRTGAVRSVAHSFVKATTPVSRTNLVQSVLKRQLYTNAKTSSFRSASTVALTLHKPQTKALLRYSSSNVKDEPPYDHINAKQEDKYAHEKMEVHPESVSAQSSVRSVSGEEGVEEQEKDVDMMAGVKADLVRSRPFQ